MSQQNEMVSTVESDITKWERELREADWKPWRNQRGEGSTRLP